jgi:outer membrane protein OmpA-like peptidoglycan-associated protein
LPAFVARLESKLVNRGFTMDPVVDAASGNQTGATTAIEARIAARAAARFPGVEVLRFDGAGLSRAQYLLTGSIARLAAGESTTASESYRIDLALTDLKSGLVVAQASARARSIGVDTTPTPYYRDSPVLLKDGSVDRTVATSRSTVGQPANPEYIARASTASLIAQAVSAYNADRLEEALSLYTRALESPGGDQIRVHSGIYLANWRLGRVAEAEAAFGRVVASGLANRNLGVKFLFRANSTEFWADSKISGPYGFWLRQIARQAASTKSCLLVVGHTNRTGTEQYNDRLSQRRAEYIRQRLESEASELAQRVQAAGKGFRENLVGSGTDDQRDALDRRVEFKVDNC